MYRNEPLWNAPGQSGLTDDEEEDLQFRASSEPVIDPEGGL